MPDSTRRWLPISNVTICDADGSSRLELVYCERRNATIPVGRCLECKHCHALTRDENGNESALLCDQVSSETTQRGALTLARVEASDLMMRDVLCVRPNLPLDTAALILMERPGQTLPVVDEHNRVLGTLSDHDLQLEVQAGRADTGTVESAMMPGARVIPESCSITRAAAIMAFEAVDCLVVVSAAQAVVGLLSAADLLFWLARSDGYLTPLKRSEFP